MTPLEMDYAFKDNWRETQTAYERARLHAVWMFNMNPYLKKGGAIEDPQKFYRFPWEKPRSEQDVKQQDLEQMEAALEEIARMAKTKTYKGTDA